MRGKYANAATDQFDGRTLIDVDTPSDFAKKRGGEQAGNGTARDNSTPRVRLLGHFRAPPRRFTPSLAILTAVAIGPHSAAPFPCSRGARASNMRHETSAKPFVSSVPRNLPRLYATVGAVECQCIGHKEPLT